MADGSATILNERAWDASLEALELPLDSPAITRLIEEVRGEEPDVTRSYNRTYNRHNR
jgi:hypothetical protein